MAKKILLFVLATLLIPLAIASSNSSSFSIDSSHSGLAGSRGLDSTESRFTLGYQQAGNPNASSISYSTNMGWMVLSDEYPFITLVSPLNNSGVSRNVTVFNYNVSDVTSMINCTLILDGTANHTAVGISKNIIQNFSLNLSIGSHNWSISCFNSLKNRKMSEERTFSVNMMSKFSGSTTDLSTVDISNITNFTIEEPNFGKIIFIENIDLSAGADIDLNVNISFNMIEINSTALSALNRSANLHLYNLTFTNPRILRDGSVCPESICHILSYVNNTLLFNVTSFTVYSAEETPPAPPRRVGWEGIGGGMAEKKEEEKKEVEKPIILPPCVENWSCSEWEECSRGMQTRECTDLNKCGTRLYKPGQRKLCPIPKEKLIPVILLSLSITIVISGGISLLYSVIFGPNKDYDHLMHLINKGNDLADKRDLHKASVLYKAFKARWSQRRRLLSKKESKEVYERGIGLYDKIIRQSEDKIRLDHRHG